MLPTPSTYTALMRALTEQPDRRRQARDVLTAYDEAARLSKQVGYALVDENTYKHALRSCDLLGEWSRALRLLDGMRDAGKLRIIKRTEGVSTTDLIGQIGRASCRERG